MRASLNLQTALMNELRLTSELPAAREKGRRAVNRIAVFCRMKAAPSSF